MNKVNIDIPILGMDRRLSERQSTPGICDVIENLQPTGSTSKPYWKKEPKVSQLRSSAGVLFTAAESDKIIQQAWHVRSSVGKFADTDSESLERPVCFLSNGKIRVYDSTFGLGGNEWGVAAELILPNSGTDVFDCSFAALNNTLAICVTKNGKPDGIYFIVDDLIIEFKYPELPIIMPFYEGNEYYTPTEIESGLYDGFRNGGLYVCYGYRFFDGSIVKQSSPHYIGLPENLDGEDLLTYKLKFYNDGFRQTATPDNIEFWEDQIESVVILVGGWKEPFENGVPKSAEKNDLENILFYEAASFAFIDPAGKTREERTVEFLTKAENLSLYPLAEVSAISNRLTAAIADSYNSRLMLGSTSEDFPIPKLPVFHNHFSRAFYMDATGGGTLRIDVIGATATGTVSASSNLSSIGFEAHGVEGTLPNRITATIDASPYSITIDYGYYSVTIEEADVLFDDEALPIANYTLESFVPLRLAIEIETSQGVFERVNIADVDTVLFTGATSNYVNAVGQVFSYPDRRAKRLFVWENDSGYVLKSVTPLTASNTQNFSYIAIGLPSNGASFTKTLPASTVNNRMNHAANRVQVSETNSPFTFLAGLTYYIGQSSNNVITAFAMNTLAISEGQFGQYPLYVFCKNSIWALEQGADPSIAFQRRSPVSLSHGVSSEKQITNLGRSIVFVYDDGIHVLYGSKIDEISQPIGNYPSKTVIDFSSLNISSRKRSGNDELLLSDSQRVYIFSTEYQRWYQVNQAHKFWFKLDGRLYSLGTDNKVYDHQELSAEAVTYKVVYDPIHFGKPDTLKRLYVVYLRGEISNLTMKVTPSVSGKIHSTTAKVLRMKERSSHRFNVELTGSITTNNEYLEGITGQVEERYPHKIMVNT